MIPNPPTVSPRDAVVGASPRRSRILRPGASVAAATDATMNGTSRSGTAVTKTRPSPTAANRTRRRQLHWAIRSNQRGTTPLRLSACGSPLRDAIRSGAISRRMIATGTARMRPRMPATAEPTVNATRTRAGWTPWPLNCPVWGSRGSTTGVAASTATMRIDASAPLLPSATRPTRATVAIGPRSGTKPPTKTSTPRARGSGRPSTSDATSATPPMIAARWAVSRIDRPTRRRAVAVPSTIIERCQGAAAWSAQSIARSASLTRKKSRKMASSPIVAPVAIAETTTAAAAVTQAGDSVHDLRHERRHRRCQCPAFERLLELVEARLERPKEVDGRRHEGDRDHHDGEDDQADRGQRHQAGRRGLRPPASPEPGRKGIEGGGHDGRKDDRGDDRPEDGRQLEDDAGERDDDQEPPAERGGLG